MKRTLSMRMLMIFFAVIAAGMLLGGCGESKKESAFPAGALTGVETIGFTECYNCHGDGKNPASFPVAFGDTAAGSGGLNGNEPSSSPDFRALFYGWLNGPHGNYAAFNGTSFVLEDRAPANPGFPDYTELESDSACAKCHDPLGDGKRIADFFLTTGVSLIGILDRPVIGCESCHGAGGNHWGLGPIATPKPGVSTCGQCHNSSFRTDHLTYHPEGGNIVEDYRSSRHASSIESHNYVSGSSSEVQAICSRCHTDQGARSYFTMAPATLNHDELISTMSGKPNVENAEPVQCKTCHDSHSQLLLLGQKAIYAGAVNDDWSDEFATCTTCHQLLNAAGNILHDGYHSPYDAAMNTVNSHASWESYLPSTHFDDPATPTRGADNSPVAGTGGIEGYVVVPSATHDPLPGNSNTGTCRDCHNEHTANTTINQSWARSKHAGNILTLKEEAAAANESVYAAAVPAKDSVQVDYFWRDANRITCQRCHTSTGYRNYANDQQNYADANGVPLVANDYSYLTGNQAELLVCWACHTDNVGALRNPGAINANYSVITSNVVTARVWYQYPDANGSNVCLACHSGRENGDSVKMLNTQGLGAVSFGNLSLITSHHLTGGGTLFGAIGYEWDGRDYTNPSFYKHDQIGTVNAPGTGSNGPCAGCHMSTSESHLFLPVTLDETTGTITAVTSTVCGKCHPGGEALSMSPSMLEDQKALFADAILAVQSQMEYRGFYVRNGSTYPVRTNTGTADVTAGSNSVTGSGTNWGSVNTGEYFRIDLDRTYYRVGTVTDDTHISLTTDYAGTTVAGANYTIIRSSGNKDWTAGGDDGSGNITGKNNMGVSFNTYALYSDPGAFAHNRIYIKRLLYDAIDWLDDFTLNYSAGTTLDAVPSTTTWKANAMSYLLVNGTATGTAAERP